jgi:hypothetical protein
MMPDATINTQDPRIFRMSPEGIRIVRKRYRNILFPLYAVVFIIVVGGELYNNGVDNPWIFAISILVSLTLLGFLEYAAYSRLKKMMESVAITWDILTISRQMRGTPDLVMYHGEIKRIERTKKGHLVIRGSQPRDLIFISKYVEDFSALQSLLEGVAPITPYSSTRFILWGGMLVNLVGLLALILAFTVNDPQAFYWLGAFALVFNVWALVNSWKNKNLPTRARTLRLVRILLLLALVAKVYADWSGLRFPQI